MVIFCPRCGGRVPNDAVFCPYCGKPIGIERTGFPTAAGVLATIASSVSLVGGLLTTFIYSTSDGYMRSNYYAVYPAIASLEFAAFLVGLTGGVYALKRKRFKAAIGGMALMSLACVFLILAAIGDYRLVGFAVFFGAPSAVLGFLSCAFISTRKMEFNALAKVQMPPGKPAPARQLLQCSICGHQNLVECNFCGVCGKPLRKDDATQFY